MDVLPRIVRRIRGHGCERLIKRTANEFKISGASFGGGTVKVDVAEFSNKVKQFVRASQLAVIVDDTQYLLCTTAARMGKEDPLKANIIKIRVMMILALGQLRAIVSIPEKQITRELRKELKEWVTYTNRLTKASIKLTSDTKLRLRQRYPMFKVTGRMGYQGGPLYLPPFHPSLEQIAGLKEVMRYQGIQEEKLDKLLHVPTKGGVRLARGRIAAGK